MKILNSFKEMIEKGTVNFIFQHIRNIMYCALIIAAGSYVHANPASFLLKTSLVNFSGWFIIGLGILLMVLNLADGIYRLSKYKNHILLDIVLTLIYILITIRLVVIVAEFRAH